MEERILTLNDDLIAGTLTSLHKAIKVTETLVNEYKPILNGERYVTDKELADILRISARALHDYRHSGILPYIRLKGNILYKESDIQKVLNKRKR